MGAIDVFLYVRLKSADFEIILPRFSRQKTPQNLRRKRKERTVQAMTYFMADTSEMVTLRVSPLV